MGMHCVQAGYKPGTTEGGAGDEVHPERHQDSTEFWRFAWDVAGSCAGDGPALVPVAAPVPVVATTTAAAATAAGCPGAWTAGVAYGEGDAVAVDGVVYRCKPWPMGMHCVQAGYKPGTTEGGAGDEVHPVRH